MRFLFYILFLGFCATGCSPCRYNYSYEGAEEFVLDSYRIQEGKFSILEMEGETCYPIARSCLEEYEDLIDEDDVLAITLFHPKRQDLCNCVNTIGSSIGYRVINGCIQLPSIPPTDVKGLTLQQAKQRIEETYQSEISFVEVFIEYHQRLHSKVELIGAVQAPEVPINGRMRLFEVLSKARVPPDANFFKSYIVRQDQILPVDIAKLIFDGDMSQNIVMHPKDKIFIADPMSSTVTVLGEVGIAQVIPVPKGSISLREAIAQAGGIPFTGDKRSIQVIRGNISNPKIYCLSWNHITYLPNQSLLLMPGDTVYISEKPITKWNRFIEQLLPSSLLIDVGTKTRGLFY